MPISNRTLDFRDILREKQNAIPHTTRRTLKSNPPALFGKEYVSEAYVIVMKKNLFNHFTFR